jgi:hypothetical protein
MNFNNYLEKKLKQHHFNKNNDINKSRNDNLTQKPTSFFCNKRRPSPFTFTLN